MTADSKGNEIKAGSIVKAKGSSIQRKVLTYNNGSITTDGKYIKALRLGSHRHDWTFILIKNVEVVS